MSLRRLTRDTVFYAGSGDIHTTDHGCYGQGYGWALIPPLISDDHLTATETL